MNTGIAIAGSTLLTLGVYWIFGTEASADNILLPLGFVAVIFGFAMLIYAMLRMKKTAIPRRKSINN